MQRVCVFCGSLTGANPRYAEAARELGAILARTGRGLVFGGGRIGLMGLVAQGALAAGGEVIGVIPRALSGREIVLLEATELIVVDTMHERKAVMADRADGFIALPGGFGTCDELFEVLTWAQLGLHEKPIGVLNTAGFFDPLLVWLNLMVADGFLKEKYRRLVLVGATPTELLNQMASFVPGPVSGSWILPAER